MSEAPARRRLDPRLYQIGALAGLLAWGLLARRLDVTPGRAALLLAAALGAQYAATRIWRLLRSNRRAR
jgi:hypothetical protein